MAAQTAVPRTLSARAGRGLIAAADRRTSPSWWLLPLMTLWANLHGGFVLGLALIGPIGSARSGTRQRERVIETISLFCVRAVTAPAARREESSRFVTRVMSWSTLAAVSSNKATWSSSLKVTSVLNRELNASFAVDNGVRKS